ncbi:MAG: hypothetical protein ACM3KT_00590 [Deltaproteobacteria bacterium]
MSATLERNAGYGPAAGRIGPKQWRAFQAMTIGRKSAICREFVVARGGIEPPIEFRTRMGCLRLEPVIKFGFILALHPTVILPMIVSDALVYTVEGI